MGSAEFETSPDNGLGTLLRRVIDAVVGPADTGDAARDADKTPSGHASWMLFERLHNTSWVQRRVEEISVTGRRLVHRQVWVVVRVDLDDADEREGNERTAIVPLNQFRKKPGVPERVFHVRDEGDTVVPALEPEERDKRLVGVLLTAADRLSPNQSELWRKLCQELVPATDPEVVCERLASLEGLLGEMSKDGSDVADLRTVLRRVAQHRFLLVPVKADGQSHCFSFEYISSDTFERSEDDDRPFDRFTARMGWRSATYKFRVPGVALTPLFQVRFRAPEGVAISESRIESSAGCDHGAGDSTLHQVDHASGGARAEDARATFCLRPHRVGLLRNGLLASAIISAMLTAGAVFTRPLDNAAGQADAAAALLLAVPSFFLFQAVQSQEHTVVSSMLAGLRRALLAVGLAAFVAAVLLVTSKEPGAPVHVAWCVLAATAGLGTVSLLVAYLFGSQPLSGPEERPTGTVGAPRFLSRTAVLMVIWLLLWGVGILAWIASLLMAELLALVALDKATLHPPLIWPVDTVVRILIGLVALGAASLPIALFVGRTRRAAINAANRAATVSESADCPDDTRLTGQPRS